MTTLFLSPHADDVCLSLGGFVAVADRPAVLVTVFTQSNWVDPSWSVRPVPTDIPRIRREEDTAFCARTGLDYMPLGLPDSGVRHEGQGDLRRRSGDEKALSISVTSAILKIVSSTRAEAIFAPMGLGGHADHAVCRDAVRKVSADVPVAYYEDLPYASELAMWRIALLTRGISPTLAPVTVEHQVDICEKVATMRECYPSQYNGVMEDAIGKHSRRLGARLGSRNSDRLVERVWLSGNRRRVLQLLTLAIASFHLMASVPFVWVD